MDNAGDGFVFLAIVTGIGGVIMTIAVGIAVSDRQYYAKFLTVLDIIIIVLFLISGFMGFSLK